MYAADIFWEWGLQETKYFKTKRERSEFLKRNEELIFADSLFELGEKIEYNRVYDVCADKSDYEMDIYL